MNDSEAFTFVKEYFRQLFIERNISALDDYLHPSYWDDDIGEPGINHIENSKSFLSRLFSKYPSINVHVEKCTCIDNVISAYLEWNITEHNFKKPIRKGIAIFELNGNKIIKRHTYTYFGANTN